MDNKEATWRVSWRKKEREKKQMTDSLWAGKHFHTGPPPSQVDLVPHTTSPELEFPLKIGNIDGVQNNHGGHIQQICHKSARKKTDTDTIS